MSVFSHCIDIISIIVWKIAKAEWWVPNKCRIRIWRFREYIYKEANDLQAIELHSIISTSAVTLGGMIVSLVKAAKGEWPPSNRMILFEMSIDETTLIHRPACVQ